MQILRFLLVIASLCLATTGSITRAEDGGPDLEVVHRIKQEAFKRSQVMQHLFHMTDVSGPRLTNSPGFDAAADWVVETAEEWGLKNVQLETWGPFGRGWSTSRVSIHLIEPAYAPLIGVPLAWSPGTEGVVTGTPILAPLHEEDDLDGMETELERFMKEWQGQLSGTIVLLREPSHLDPKEEPPTKRWSDSELAERSKARELYEPIEIDYANPKIPKDPHRRRRFWAHAPSHVREKIWKRYRRLNDRLNGFLDEQGARLVIHPASYGDGGTIFPPQGGSYKTDAPLPPPSIALTPEHYNRIARLVEREVPMTIEVEVRATIHDESLDAVNVIAEIPGGSKKDELVMIGAHFDDVVYGTGTTDNAAGCAVMLEVMRILKTLDLELDRTVRMALWSGEEQGLLGSKAYIKHHFGDPRTMELEPDHAKLSAYYNLDNGTGKIRGIYLQGNDMVRPIFESWLSPFRDLGTTTVTIRNTGGTDHLSFDAVGLPGFQFIQDPVEYNSRTHHSNMDVYDRAQAGDLMQAAAVIASFVHETANRDELLPRKPLPEPWPEGADDEDD